MQQELFADEHLRVTLDSASGLVRYVRSERPYASLETVRSIHATMTQALRAHAARPLKLLIDSRAAPARNDPDFEAEIVRAFQTFGPLFIARAMLVKSAVGKLQVQRLTREVWSSSLTPAVFSSEADALAYLEVGTAAG
jgi:hypothetical protein